MSDLGSGVGVDAGQTFGKNEFSFGVNFRASSGDANSRTAIIAGAPGATGQVAIISLEVITSSA